MPNPGVLCRAVKGSDRSGGNPGEAFIRPPYTTQQDIPEEFKAVHELRLDGGNSRFCISALIKNPCKLRFTGICHFVGYVAERTRFELVVRVTPYVGLANRWFQPLTHLSGHFRPSIWPKGCANIESFCGTTKKEANIFLPTALIRLSVHALRQNTASVLPVVL